MQITTDWHIHTTHSCDCGLRDCGVVMASLVADAARQGITDLGVTDHIHTPYNLNDLHDSRGEFLALPFAPRFHFGVEVSCVSQWEIDEIESGRQQAQTYGLRTGGPAGGELAIGIAAEDVAECGLEYVIGGTHWPIYVPEISREAVIADYHRQNMFLAAHPLVNIIAHPWWWMGQWKSDDGKYRSDPWLDDFGKIHRSVHDEFAAAVLEHHKAVEINIHACLTNPTYPADFGKQYADYLAYLHERGVTLSVGSDCHGRGHIYEADWERAARLLEAAGVGDAQLWSLPPRAAPNEE